MTLCLDLLFWFCFPAELNMQILQQTFWKLFQFFISYIDVVEHAHTFRLVLLYLINKRTNSKGFIYCFLLQKDVFLTTLSILIDWDSCSLPYWSLHLQYVWSTCVWFFYRTTAKRPRVYFLLFCNVQMYEKK